MSPRFDQSKFLKRAKEGVQKELASPDHIIVQVVCAIDELNKISNLSFERLNEWYGLHFPEFRHKEPVKYAKVARVLDRIRPDKAALEQLLPDTYTAILQKANTSVGVQFSEEDMMMLRMHADALLNLYELKAELEKYEDKISQKLCPNVSALAGPKVASQLVAHAGSIKKLALMPSSTIQVIGAEKALFKHLKSGSPPPKHGLIFQHPQISMAPKHARGKIARALAAKITIAAKADAFSHNDISAKLKEQFDKRVADILLKAKDGSQKKKPQVQKTFGGKTRDFSNRRSDSIPRYGSASSGSYSRPPPRQGSPDSDSRPRPHMRQDSDSPPRQLRRFEPSNQGGSRDGSLSQGSQNRPRFGGRNRGGKGNFGSRDFGSDGGGERRQGGKFFKKGEGNYRPHRHKRR